MVRGFSLSLRRYILIALLVMGAGVIAGYSYLTTANFFAGMDGVMRGTMITVARNATVKPGEPQEIMYFNVAAAWEDLPESVTSSFNPEQIKPYRFYKKVERPFIFFRPSSAVFLVKVVDRNGEKPTLYVSHTFDPPPDAEDNRFAISHEGWSMLLGLGVLVVFAGILMVLMRSVARPVERLRKWARGLNEQTLQQPTPDFRYNELNELAGIIHSSLQHVREGLEREREFVSHASHELRTPIAVIRSSVELLHKLAGDTPGKGSNAIRRIDHASHTMTDLTETLLWLGRQDHDALPATRVQPGAMLEGLVQDLSYLLTGKQVEIDVHTDETACTIPATALRIVLGNLIRNAFQHTQCGSVRISQSGNQLSIVNVNSDDDGLALSAEAENQLGYGLGLELVQRVTAKLGWHYEQRMTPSGCEVSITLV